MTRYSVNDYLNGAANQYWLSYRNKGGNREGCTYSLYCASLKEAIKSLNKETHPERELLSVYHMNINDSISIIDFKAED